MCRTPQPRPRARFASPAQRAQPTRRLAGVTPHWRVRLGICAMWGYAALGNLSCTAETHIYPSQARHTPLQPAQLPPVRLAETKPDAAVLASAIVQQPDPAPRKPPPVVENEPEIVPKDMLLVPAGPFSMGADSGGEADERPAHTVNLPAFWLDTTEVSNEAYGQCVAAQVCAPHRSQAAPLAGFGPDAAFRTPQQPVSGVAWADARTYCGWRNKRLPREAEWEKAARGSDARRYPWGNEPATPERAVFGRRLTAEVGSHPLGRGPYGHLDLAGNVWEWLEDIYDPYAYRRAGADRGIAGDCSEVLLAQKELREQGLHGFTGSNPIPDECERVLRGGAFNYDGPGLRASNRVHHPERFRIVMAGFRCAKDKT